jgi:hypothetical protein
MHKYKITWRPSDSFGTPSGTEIIEAQGVNVEENRIVFWAYDRRGAVPERYIVLSAKSEDLLTYGRVVEPVADDDLPAKPLVKYPKKLALFKVEFRDEDQADELIWAENAEFENGRPPVPLCGFYATLQTSVRSLLRSIWTDRIAEVTCIRPPESAA